MVDTQDIQKRLVAEHAVRFVEPDMVLGVGTGSTSAYFIQCLAKLPFDLAEVVSSSVRTTELLQKVGIHPVSLNTVSGIDLYIDGADEVDDFFYCIKGGGGAMTLEKIVASAARKFICLVDSSKLVGVLGEHPLAIEVIQEARSFVAREMVLMGANPVYREGFVTDQGHVILDIYGLDFSEPLKLEKNLNQIPGVVGHGLFATRRADMLLVGNQASVEVRSAPSA